MSILSEAEPAPPQGRSPVGNREYRAKADWVSRALVGAIVARLASAISAELKFRRSIRELTRMSDYGLRDLGLCRCDAERVVRYGRF